MQVNLLASVPATVHASVPEVSVSVIDIDAAGTVFSSTLYVDATVAAGVWSFTSVIVIAVVCAPSAFVPSVKAIVRS